MQKKVFPALFSLLVLIIPGSFVLADEAEFHLEDCMESVLNELDGNVIKVEYRFEEEDYVYEFDLRDKKGLDWEFVCSSKTGEIIEKEREVHSFLSIEYSETVKLSLAEARKVAQQVYPGEIIEIEYEIEENGIPVYEFDVLLSDGREIKVEINARNGEIYEAYEELWQIGYE